MSYWSTIYAGDAARIMPVLGTEEDVENADFVVGSTELSGIHDYHLQSLMQMLDGASATFAAHVAETRVGDDEEWYAHRMQPSFGAMFAALTNAQIADLVPRWLEALGGRPNPDSIVGCNEQLQALATLCRTAKDRGVDVVFSCWI